jgi:hypothetical protein
MEGNQEFTTEDYPAANNVVEVKIPPRNGRGVARL